MGDNGSRGTIPVCTTGPAIDRLDAPENAACTSVYVHSTVSVMTSGAPELNPSAAAFTRPFKAITRPSTTAFRTVTQSPCCTCGNGKQVTTRSVVNPASCVSRICTAYASHSAWVVSIVDAYSFG